MAANEIIQELSELGSSLTGTQREAGYQAPAGYFDGLAGAVLHRIRTMEAGDDPKAELAALSPLLSSMDRKLPYNTPAGYWEELDFSARVAMAADFESAAELDNISPLLSELKKQPTYSVPAGYFDQVSIPRPVAEKKNSEGARVISMGSRQGWKRYAAAASVAVLLTISGLLIFNNKKGPDPSTNSYAWVEKNMKKVSQEEIDELVNLADAVAPVATSGNGSGGEINDLMKNISDSEIDRFLRDIENALDNGDNDPILN